MPSPKGAKFLSILSELKKKVFFLKNFQIDLRDKKEVVLLHPLWEISEKIIRHVPRHIELTAVLREISKQIKE